MKHLVITAVIALAVSGCAPRTILWDKEGASSQEFYRDKFTCSQAAGSRATVVMPIGNMLAAVPVMNNAGFADWMQAEGWTPEVSQ